MDGTKFRAVASADSVRERQALERYLDSMEKADEEQQATIDPTAVQAAVEKLKRHPEPEARFMPVTGTKAPAYNVQTAVDAEHALIVAHAITLDAGDNRCLEPMAEAAKEALGAESLNIVADAGYSNGEQAGRCEAAGMMPYVPGARGANTLGDGTLFGREKFTYQPETDTYRCPAGQTLVRKQIARRNRSINYAGQPATCGACSLKPNCTLGKQRWVTRHMDDDALDRMHQRVTPALMRCENQRSNTPSPR